jgi:hypothetical protein
MPIDFQSWHVGGGTAVAGLVVLFLVWKSIKFLMRLVLLAVVLALAAGAWVGYEYHLTGKLPF